MTVWDFPLIWQFFIYFTGALASLVLAIRHQRHALVLVVLCAVCSYMALFLSMLSLYQLLFDMTH